MRPASRIGILETWKRRAACDARTVLVYALHMSRTNVEVDDAVIARVMRRYGLRTKRAAIDLALRRLDLEPMDKEEALAMRGGGWQGDLEKLRGGYVRPS